MRKKNKKTRSRHGLQAVTLCISTAMVLVLLGLVVFAVCTARNLSAYVKQNIVVTMMLQDDMTSGEAQQFCTKLKARPYIHTLQYISKELKAYPKVSEVKYQKDLIDSVNANIAKISIVLLALAVLLTIVSFSLINNTVRLSIYARRFSIHTMKLVGASWGFIRAPFVRHYVLLGLLAALIACCVLGGGVYALFMYEPQGLDLITWEVLAITAGTVVVFGIFITAICSIISVNKFLRMKAGDLYKI